MAAKIPTVVCVSRGESKRKPAALNRAIALAKGDVIAIFDSDSRYEPDLLLRIAKYLHDHPEVDVTQAFPQVMNADSNVITLINYYEVRFWFQGLQAAKEHHGLFMHLAGTGMFIRRRVLEELGPWDEGCLTEDFDYSVRVARSEFRVGMVDADISIKPTYRALHLVRQRMRWWGGALQVFGRAVRQQVGVGMSFRQRLDGFIYTLSPIVFFVSSVSFFATLLWFFASGGLLLGLLSFAFGLLASNLLLIPLVVAESIAVRERRLLWLVPGLYWYWVLQLASLLAAAIEVSLVPQRLVWRRTPKVRVD